MLENNGLLMLYQAAIALEGPKISENLMDIRTVRPRKLKLMKICCEKFKTNSNISLRNSHNEIERSRRAHLRNCMERLKRKLSFKNECHLNRITMFRILRKAASTIKEKEKSIFNLYKTEYTIKNQNAQLKQRLLILQKQLILFNQYSKNQEKRFRNISECSVYTTSSEESLIEDRFFSQLTQMKCLEEKKFEINSVISNSSDSGIDESSYSGEHKYSKLFSSIKSARTF